MSRAPGLDGLRAVAVAGVVVSHVEVPHLIGAAIGVQVFFVLSGFLITTLLVREHTATGRLDLPRFAARRALRLAPPLVVVLSAWAVWVTLQPDAFLARETRDGILPSALYYANWIRFTEGYTALGWLAPMWSLAVEEQFYLLWPFPLLLLLRRKLGTAAVVLGLACCVSLVFRVHDLWDLTHTYRRFGTHEVADQLLIGCALALLLERGSASARQWLDVASRRAVAPAVGFLLVIALTLTETPPLTYHRFFYTVGLSLVGIATAVLLVRLVLHADGWAARLLSSRPLPWIGRRSYAIYLWHELFRMLATNGQQPSTPVLLIIVAVGSVVAAALSFALVEGPCLAWKRRNVTPPRSAAPAFEEPATQPAPTTL